MSMPNVQFTVTGTGTSPVYACDNFQNPFNIGYGTTISATATFKLEYTFDDVQAEGYNPATGTWFTVTGTSGSTAVSDSFTTPCRGIRLNVSANTGYMVVYFQQAGCR
jgi:hypothetical protein